MTPGAGPAQLAARMQTAPAPAPSRSALRTTALVVLAALALCCLAVAAGARREHKRRAPEAPRLTGATAVVEGWVAWDSGWYRDIALHGYPSFTPGQQSAVAFFPLYPLAVRGVNAVVGDVYAAGVLVTLLCGPLALLLFVLWARHRAPEADVRVAGALLALYPFTLYLYGAMYSDALFVLLVVASFLLLEQGRLVPAVLVAAVATAARPVAPALVLGLLVRRWEWKRERGLRWGPQDALPVLAAAGFGLYCLYLWQRFGDPFAFVQVQGAPGWDQAPGWRTWLKLSWFHAVFVDATVGPRDTARFVVHAALTLLALALVWPTRKRLGWGYAAYCAAIVGMPALSTKDFMGMGRYLLSAFPLFLTLALLLRERPRLRAAAVVASGVGLLLLSLMYGTGAYVS